MCHSRFVLWPHLFSWEVEGVCVDGELREKLRLLEKRFRDDPMATFSGAVSKDGDEAERMWNRLLSVERSIKIDREAIATMQGDRRGPYEGFSPEMAELYEKLVVSFKKVQGISHQMRRELHDCYPAFVNFFNVVVPSETYETLKPYELEIAATFETLDIDTSSAVLEWFEDRQADSVISSPRIFGILSKFLECDQERRWESRYLKLFWKHCHGVSESDLVFCLNKVAKHYTPNPEIEAQEKFMQTTAKRAMFLNACSSADIAIWFSNDVDRALNKRTKVYDEKEKCWAKKENAARHKWNKTTAFAKLANALAVDLPITSRHDTAQECLNRLELARHMSPDLNPHESHTLASVISTVISPEVQTLKALKDETKLYHKTVVQVEELSDRHLQAYEALKKEQFERLDKFFETCQNEKEDVVKEALYTKAKCLASIERASICGDVKMSSEDLLKRMLQEAGGAFKKAEGEHKVETVDKADNSECALCYSKFSKKRKRACLDPCGHASACFDCATKAWEQKPNCPWCKAIVAKPISVPAKLFF